MVYGSSSATWALRTSLSAGAPDDFFNYGSSSRDPILGNWTGAGVGAGEFDPTTATWYLRNSLSGGAPDIAPFAFGAPGWDPAAGDWTGSGHTGIGVFDTSTATFYLRDSVSAGARTVAWAPDVAVATPKPRYGFLVGGGVLLLVWHRRRRARGR